MADRLDSEEPQKLNDCFRHIFAYFGRNNPDSTHLDRVNALCLLALQRHRLLDHLDHCSGIYVDAIREVLFLLESYFATFGIPSNATQRQIRTLSMSNLVTSLSTYQVDLPMDLLGRGGQKSSHHGS